MRKDLQDRSDIELLVNSFYEKVKADGVLAPLFLGVNWEIHLPRMYDFWSTIILNTGEFKGNPVAKHLALNKKHKLDSFHFDAWLKLWNNTLDEYFSGANATIAKERARSIKDIILYKLKFN